VDQAVRRGDLLAVIIEYHYEMGEYDKCLQYLKLMKERGIIITPYIDK
jgi:pentatricopeptide repeat protein